MSNNLMSLHEMKNKREIASGIKYLLRKKIIPNYILYLFVLPAIIYLLIFNYWPMYGIQIAFKDFKAGLGIMGSPWAGFKHFSRFFSSYMFWTLIKNTLSLSIYQLIAGFPFPIILALCLHYSFNKKFKRFTQTITYAPHFISTVVIVGMILIFLSPRNGIVNIIISALGGKPIFFMGKPEFFRHIYVWSGIWQNMGWGSIIYIAVLTNVDPELHEAAIVDGAIKIKRVWYIDIPVLLPTTVTLLIMNMGKILSIGFEKVFLMQNSTNIMVSEIVATYVYKAGLLNAEYSFTTAVGLFNNVINLVLLLTVNWFAGKVSGHGLF